MRPLRSGEYRHRVQYETRATSHNTAGELVTTWTASAANILWAAVEPQSGTESEQASSTQAATTYIVRFRYRGTGVVPHGRFTWNGITLNIRSVVNTEERNRETICVCEVASDAVSI